MATIWYAQKSDNINAANVWNDAADGSGAWFTWHAAYDAGVDYVAGNKVQHKHSTDPLAWYNCLDANGPGSAVKEPGASGSEAFWEEIHTGDSFRANEFIITINVDVPECVQLDTLPRVLPAWNVATAYSIGDRVQFTPTSGSLRQYRALTNHTGSTPPSTGNSTDWQYVTGGYFTAAPGSGVTRTVNANVVSGTNGSTGAIQNTGVGTVTVTKDVTGGSVITLVAAERAYGSANNSTGTINIGGDSTGGAGTSAIGVYNVGAGTINITGNSTGGAGDWALGSRSDSAGTINIAGNSTGGAGTSSHGSWNVGAGTINITGNSTGGEGTSSYGSWNFGAGTLNITGNSNGGAGGSAYGTWNNSTGIINITGDSNGGAGTNAYGTWNNSTGIINITGNSTGHATITTSFGARNSAAGTINIGGNVTKQAAEGYSSLLATGNLVLNGTGNQTYDNTSANSIGNLTINKASGTATFASNCECEQFLLDDGDVDLNGKTLECNGTFTIDHTAGDLFDFDGGKVICEGNIDWSTASGEISGTGTLEIAKTGLTLNAPYNATPLRKIPTLEIDYPLTITSARCVTAVLAAGVNLTINGPFHVEGNLTLPAGTTHTGAGTVTVGGAFSAPGTKANRIYIIGPDFVVTGAATASWTYARDSDATAGTVILAESSYGEDSPGWWFQCFSAAEVEGILDARHLTAAVGQVQAALASGTLLGEVAADVGNSTTQFKSTITGETNNFIRYAWVLFYDGALQYEAQPVATYDGTTGIFTVAAAFTATPVAGTKFILIGRS